MTKVPKAYGAFVNVLPINPRRKGWLRRNWLGGLLGIFTFPIIWVKLIIKEELISLILDCPSAAEFMVECTVSMSTIFNLIILGIIGLLIGAFIQSKLRGRK